MSVTRVTPPASRLTAAVRVARGGFALDVAVEAAPGEVLGVLGPNGAGKSTLLRVLAGLLAVDSGQVRLGGAVLDDPAAGVFVAPAQRPVGLVFQDYRLFPHLSVQDNVAFALRSARVPRAQARATARTWLERLGVAEVAGRRPTGISGGQAQRVALARTLASSPDLLLLDEPMAALDARTRIDVRATLREHLGAFAGPTLLVTHDPLEAMVLADRLVVLEHGRVVQDAAPADVARRPATPYVARLVGLNLYRGQDRGDGRVALDGGGTLVTLPGGDGAARPVTLAVRPSAIALHAARPEAASPRNVWPGRVSGMEPLGDRVRLRVAGPPDALVDLTAAAVAELRVQPGQQVWLTAKATDVASYPTAEGASGER